MVTPIRVTEPQILSSDIFWMLGFSAVLIPLIFLPKRFQISRVKGFFLVIGYGIFMFLVFTHGKL